MHADQNVPCRVISVLLDGVSQAQDGSKKADDTRTREEVIKAAFKSMLTRELAWLRGLSKKEQARLDQRAYCPRS